MAIINNSKDKPYYTQRNNRLKPNGACNVTAMIAALSAAGWAVEKIVSEKFSQPEDVLMDFILNDERTNECWRRLDPLGHYPPNEWHQVLALGTNLLLRKMGIARKDETVVDWGECRTKEQIVQTIIRGGSCVLSGIFSVEGKKTIGHVVACVGFKTDDKGILSHFIIDDSWGDYRTEYADHNGKNIEMPVSDFVSKIRHCGTDIKRGHLIKKAGL